ncbi:MAG: CDP-diacylglycerol--serine O-phosphatidyltransferase [Gammaproteobacteria bacterium]
MPSDSRRKRGSKPGPKPGKGIYLLPNLFTTAALFAGFYAVVVAMRGEFEAAAIGILTAMVFDGLDGRVARWTQTSSDFGAEYDSLSDMVAFGLAPALVFYQWSLTNLPEGNVAFARLGWIAAFFYTVTAAMRLARFNSRPSKTPSKFFEGLPSPSAAGLVASALWLSAEFDLGNPWVLASGYVLTICAGILMVSNFKYYSGKEFNFGHRIRFTRLLMVPLLFMLIAVNPPLVFTLLFFTYALSGPLIRVWRRVFRRTRSRVRQSKVVTETPQAMDDTDADDAEPEKSAGAPSQDTPSNVIDATGRTSRRR